MNPHALIDADARISGADASPPVPVLTTHAGVEIIVALNAVELNRPAWYHPDPSVPGRVKGSSTYRDDPAVLSPTAQCQSWTSKVADSGFAFAGATTTISPTRVVAATSRTLTLLAILAPSLI